MKESEIREILDSVKTYLEGFIYNNNEAEDDAKKVVFSGGMDINELQIRRMNKKLKRIPVKKGKLGLYKELFEDLQIRLDRIKANRKLGQKMGSPENLLKSWKGVEGFLLNPDNTD